MKYGVGARVRVQVSRVDLDSRKIDFRLVHEGQTEPPLGNRAKRDRTLDRDGSAVSELASIKEADRAVKAAKRKVGAPKSHASRAVKTLARKGPSKATKRR